MGERADGSCTFPGDDTLPHNCGVSDANVRPLCYCSGFPPPSPTADESMASGQTAWSGGSCQTAGRGAHLTEFQCSAWATAMGFDVSSPQDYPIVDRADYPRGCFYQGSSGFFQVRAPRDPNPHTSIWVA